MNKIAVLIILLGAFFRLSEYASNPSLNSDEALTALRLGSITLKEAFFLKGSDEMRQQSYPILFLAALKASKGLWGENEFALRSVVLVASLISLWLFYEVARLFVPGAWALAALALFCVSRDLVYMSIELKPVAFDILSVLIFTRMAAAQPPSAWPWKKALVCALAGFVLVFFSIAGIIFMVSAASCLTFYWLTVEDHGSVRKFAPVLGAILLATIFYYGVSLRYIDASVSLSSYWASSFFPLEGSLFEQYQWVVVVFKRLFGKFLQYPVLLSAALFVAGLSAAWIKDKAQFIFLVAPVMAAIAASAVKIYPFDGRAIFFLVPFVIIALVHGVRLAVGFSAMKRSAAVILVALLLVPALNASAQQWLEYAGAEEIKPALHYIEHQRKDADTVLVYEGASRAYTYYAKLFDVDAPLAIVNRHNIDEVMGRYVSDHPAGSRVWVIFTHVKFDARLNERLFILENMKARAKAVDALEIKVRPGSVIPTLEGHISSSAYLFQI